MVRVHLTLVVLAAVLLVTRSAPVRYDQRQDGDLNVMAHLQNIVFVFIPTSANSVVPNLINLASNVYKNGQPVNTYNGAGLTSEEGKASGVEPHETKSYSVEVISVKEEAPEQSPLAKLHPDPAPSNAEVLVAQSPPVALSKVPEKIPTPDPSLIIPASEVASIVAAAAESPKPEQVKVPEKVDAAPPTPIKVKTAKVIVFTDELPMISARKMAEVHDKDQNKVKLLSAGLEECAPDQRRNSQGLCQQIKPRARSGQYIPLDHLLPALRFGLSPAA